MAAPALCAVPGARRRSPGLEPDRRRLLRVPPPELFLPGALRPFSIASAHRPAPACAGTGLRPSADGRQSRDVANPRLARGTPRREPPESTCGFVLSPPRIPGADD